MKRGGGEERGAEGVSLVAVERLEEEKVTSEKARCPNSF